jgi:hypothetical protein
MMLERSGWSITVLFDSPVFQTTECRSCAIRLLRLAVLLFAQNAPADLQWLPAWDALFKVSSEAGPDLSWSVGQICTPNFFAFALYRIREAWKVPSMAEAELWAPKAMSHNCEGILDGAPFVALPPPPTCSGS